MGKQYWKKMSQSKYPYNKIVYITGSIILGIVYFFMLGDDGPHIMRDSEAFLNPSSAILQSYWLYANYLKVCEIIWGHENFLYAVYIIQGIIAMCTSIFVTEYFRKYYRMGYLCAFLVYVFTLLPYGYSLPDNVVTHHIMTEGLSIPIFHICILFACRSFLEKKYRYMVIAVFAGVLLALTRSQLLVFIPILVFLLAIIFTKEVIVKMADKMRLKRKQFILSFLLVSSLLLIVFIYTVFAKTNIGSQFMAAISGRVMCLMEYEDRELFEGEMREIYDTLYKNADEGGHLEKYFRTDSWRSYDIAVHTNENTKEGLNVIRDFYSLKYPEMEDVEFKQKSYSDRDFIVTKVFSNHILDYVIMSIQLMTQSFVASVFIQPDSIRNLCYIVTFFIYLGTFGVMYIARRRMKIDKKYIIPMSITLLFLISNVVFTNIIFYGQQRYVIYTFGMFYISWFIMMLGTYRKRKELVGSE